MNNYIFILPVFIGVIFLLASIYSYRKKQDRVNTNSMELIKQAIVYNTGSITNFRFEIESAHKELKIHLLNQNKYELKQAITHFEETIHKSLFSVFEVNVEYLANYFAGRALRPPRICLKLNHDGKIITGFSSKTSEYYSEYSPEENTGFYSIISRGNYFLLNNIPEAAKKSHYKNPRLNYSCVASYKKNPLKYIRSLLDKTYTDTDWQKCWVQRMGSDGSQVKPSIESCYKSTLIVPIALPNNSLSFSFKEFFQIPESSGTILGFLCFDHLDENYFNASVDIDIATIFAHLLSSFFVDYLKHTTHSQVFEMAKKAIENNDIS